MNFTRGTGNYNTFASSQRGTTALVAVVFCVFSSSTWAGSGNSIIELSGGASVSGPANNLSLIFARA